MIRFHLSDSNDSQDKDASSFSEQEEIKLFSRYNNALELQGNNQVEGARKLFEEILNHDLLKNDTTLKEALKRLKYLTLKNFAKLLESINDYESALCNYSKVSIKKLI